MPLSDIAPETDTILTSAVTFLGRDVQLPNWEILQADTTRHHILGGVVSTPEIHRTPKSVVSHSRRAPCVADSFIFRG
jgi:hypothetical protein